MLNNYQNNKKNKTKFNYGLSILKVLLALDVILAHNLDKKKKLKNRIYIFFLKRRKLHVPSFFIISFYFMYKNFILLDINKIKNRFERLFIPYLLWPIIIWVLNNLIKIIFNNSYFTSFEDLKNQLLWGNTFLIQFWFQWDLMVITILFIFVISLFKNNYLFIFQLFLFFGYFLQYSGYNKKFYIYLNKEKKKCLSRLATMTPYAVTGFTLSFFKYIDILKIYKFKSLILSIIIFFLIDNFKIFSNLNNFYVTYSGIKLNFHSISLISIFSVFSFENISNTRIIKILKYLTNYTAGIFYLHWSVIIYSRYFIKPIRLQSFFGCVFVYIACYLISFIGINGLGHTKLKYLFS